MLRFASLGSGSKGNALLVHAGATRILIDCGFGIRSLSERLSRLGMVAEQLDAVFITHEHSDHVAGLTALQRRTGCPAYLSEGTLFSVNGRRRLSGPVVRVHDGESVAVGELTVTPYAVPHDAAEPLQFVVGDGAVRLGILTDAGSVTDSMVTTLSGCDGLMIEFNHDSEMLRSGPYPAFLKRRIAGARGHLDNQTAAGLLARLMHDGLRHVVGAHLSDQNNSPAAVRSVMARTLRIGESEVHIAGQAHGHGWLELRGAFEA